MVESSGFRVQGSGFRVQGSGFRDEGVDQEIFGTDLDVPALDNARDTCAPRAKPLNPMARVI